MDISNLIIWIISCIFALIIFGASGYFLRKIIIRFLPLFIVAEFLATGLIVYLFMIVLVATPSIAVAFQPMFLAAFIVSIVTAIFIIACKFSSVNFLKKIKDFLCKFGYVFTVFIGAALLIYGFINVQGVCQVDYNIKSDKLNNQYQIVFLSDVHYGDGQLVNNLEKVVNKISAVNPDYLIIGGDLVDDFTTKSQMHEVVDALSSISIKKSKYFVGGNHELTASSMVEDNDEKFSMQDLYQYLRDHEIEVIDDKVVHVNDDLAIIGEGDSGFPSQENNGFFTAYTKNDEFILCVEHDPGMWKENSDYGIDLQISGHYHFGQLFPLGIYGQMIGMTAYGEYDNGKSKLIVSSGFGSWEYPIRTGNHCEYLLISLMPQ